MTFDGFVTPPVFDGFIDGFNARGLGTSKIIRDWSTLLPITFVDMAIVHYQRNYTIFPGTFTDALIAAYSPTIAPTPAFTELLLHGLFKGTTASPIRLPNIRALSGSPAPTTDTRSLHPGWTEPAWFMGFAGNNPNQTPVRMSNTSPGGITDLGTSMDFLFTGFITHLLYSDDLITIPDQFWLFNDATTGNPIEDADRILFFFNPNGVITMVTEPGLRPGSPPNGSPATGNLLTFSFTIRVLI